MKKETQQERRKTPKYPRRPRSVYDTTYLTKYTGDECRPPPPKKKNKQKTLFIVAMSCKVSNTTNTCSNKNCHTVKQSHCHCETVYDQLTLLTKYGSWLENWLKSSPMSLEAQLSSLSLFSDTVRLSCAFAPLFMVNFQYRYCFLSIYKIHIIIEMLCIANIDFLDD